MAREAKKFRTYYSDNAPGIKIEFEFIGEDGGTYTAGFSISSDFFWF